MKNIKNKIIPVITLMFTLLFASLVLSKVSGEELVGFNMCSCIEKAKIFSNINNTREARRVCKEFLIKHLMDKSEKSGKIETIIIIGCND